MYLSLVDDARTAAATGPLTVDDADLASRLINVETAGNFEHRSTKQTFRLRAIIL